MNTPPTKQLHTELLKPCEVSPLQPKDKGDQSQEYRLDLKVHTEVSTPKNLMNLKEFQSGTRQETQEYEELDREITTPAPNDQIPLVQGGQTQQAVLDSAVNPLFEEYLPRVEAKLYLRRNIAYFIAVGLTSLATYLTIEKYTSFQSIFYALYSYFVYCIFSNFRRSRLSRREFWRTREDAFCILDNLVNLAYLIGLHLSLLKMITFSTIFAVPYLLTTILYYFLSKGTTNTKIVRLAIRSLFTIQAFLITMRFNGIISWNWFFVLMTSGIYLIVVFGFFFSICLAFIYRFKGDDEFFQPCYKGLAWHLLYYALGVIAVLGMIGIPFAFNTKRGFGVLKFATYFGMGLSTILVSFSLASFKDLIVHLQDFWISDHFLLEPLPQFPTEQEIKFKVEKKTSYFMTISTTFFKYIENKSEYSAVATNDGRQGEEERHNEEENLCYLCYEKSANAILGDCGHGGICYDCVIPLIKKKNKCMECRCDVNEVYKVEQDHENPKMVKSVELSKVVVK